MWDNEYVIGPGPQSRSKMEPQFAKTYLAVSSSFCVTICSASSYNSQPVFGMKVYISTALSFQHSCPHYDPRLVGPSLALESPAGALGPGGR